ncbi:hypothetical protein B0H13DRAFT_2373184 [Mycena leptocephala]|nr:hypothetical protein B0H13DRAFT_2373184 [Mycena leptocephala]
MSISKVSDLKLCSAIRPHYCFDLLFFLVAHLGGCQSRHTVEAHTAQNHTENTVVVESQKDRISCAFIAVNTFAYNILGDALWTSSYRVHDHINWFNKVCDEHERTVIRCTTELTVSARPATEQPSSSLPQSLSQILNSPAQTVSAPPYSLTSPQSMPAGSLSCLLNADPAPIRAQELRLQTVAESAPKDDVAMSEPLYPLTLPQSMPAGSLSRLLNTDPAPIIRTQELRLQTTVESSPEDNVAMDSRGWSMECDDVLLLSTDDLGFLSMPVENLSTEDNMVEDVDVESEPSMMDVNAARASDASCESWDWTVGKFFSIFGQGIQCKRKAEGDDEVPPKPHKHARLQQSKSSLSEKSTAPEAVILFLVRTSKTATWEQNSNAQFHNGTLHDQDKRMKNFA